MAFDAVIRNVSHSGLFVESDLLEPVGTPCEIVVALPNRGCRTLRGWVARLSLDANSTEPAGMGIHFVRQDGTRQIVAELMEVA